MIIVADNISAGRPSVRRIIAQRDGQALDALCRRLAGSGADWLDLNPGFLPKNQRAEVWRWLVTTAEAACVLPLVLDTPRPDELALALGFCTRPPVLNMATAEDGRLAPVLDLAAAHDLSLVAAAMTATTPADAEERLALTALIVAEASRRGIDGPRLWIDPMVLPLALPGGEAQAAAVLASLRAIPFLFEPAPRTLLAVSNLTTATAAARAGFVGPAFLAAAFGAGLGAAMVDVTDPALMKTVALCRVMAGERIFAPAEFGGEG